MTLTQPQINIVICNNAPTIPDGSAEHYAKCLVEDALDDKWAEDEKIYVSQNVYFDAFRLEVARRSLQNVYVAFDDGIEQKFKMNSDGTLSNEFWCSYTKSSMSSHGKILAELHNIRISRGTYDRHQWTVIYDNKNE